MFTFQLRRLIDTPFAAAAGKLAGSPVDAISVTMSGFAAGLVAFGCVATHRPLVGLTFLVLNRALAALARSLAGLKVPTDIWTYLDRVLDFLIGAGMPLAFALGDPSRALAATFLVLSLACAGTALLALQAIAAQRGHSSVDDGAEGYSLAERTMIFVAFAVACLAPAWFSIIAYVVGVLYFVLMGIRVANAVESLR